MIVGLGHQAQVGKDTAASILVEKYGFKRLAFADKLKEMAYDINPRLGGTMPPSLAQAVDTMGWEKAKMNGEVREFLQRLGVAARDHLGPDVWVDPVLLQIAGSSSRVRWVVTDVRFPNEFRRLAIFDAVMLKLTRESAVDLNFKLGAHISETALADAEWDIVMGNNGTLEDLEVNLVAALDLEAVA